MFLSRTPHPYSCGGLARTDNVYDNKFKRLPARNSCVYRVYVNVLLVLLNKSLWSPLCMCVNQPMPV